MITVIVDEALNISHDLGITLVCIGGHFEEVLAMFLVNGRGLGAEDEGHGEEALHG